MGQSAHTVLGSVLDSEKMSRAANCMYHIRTNLPRTLSQIENMHHNRLHMAKMSVFLSTSGLIPDIILPLSPCSPFPLRAAAAC